MKWDVAPILASSWWLPANHSEHGSGFDGLFTLILWITVGIFVLIHIVLLTSLIRHRNRPGRTKAWFIHGNNRLEIFWTIIPAIILTVVSLLSTRVWQSYHAMRDIGQPDAVRVLVIGQQFKWNVIYPGPDGQLGRYLLYPSTTDERWPDGQRFRGSNGPAALPQEKREEAINAYIEQINPLGKDLTDPLGTDDDWRNALARDLVVPVGRRVEVYLASRDVIHDFAVPLMRVKMDTIPGTIGLLTFMPTKISADEPGGAYDIVCEELCGTGHYTMRGRLVVVDNAAYERAEHVMVTP